MGEASGLFLTITLAEHRIDMVFLRNLCDVYYSVVYIDAVFPPDRRKSSIYI